MIECTKLDLYYVASPSPFAHRQITWIASNVKKKHLSVSFRNAIFSAELLQRTDVVSLSFGKFRIE